jgi:GxxExxY protein
LGKGENRGRWCIQLKEWKQRMGADEHQTLLERERLNAIGKRIIGCAYAVGNVLGAGFLEKIYENALAHELRKTGLSVATQFPISVHYDGVIVGEYLADLLVEQRILIELKAVKDLDDIHVAQCMNYLKATGLQVCLLINFGASRVVVKRIVNRF